LPASTVPMLGVPQHASITRERTERRLALLQRQAAKIAPVQVQEIEDEVGEAAAITAVERVLQGLEAGAPVRQHDGDLAIDQRAARIQLRGGFADLREVARPVVAFAADERDRPLLNAAPDAVAVELHLVQPAISLRRSIDEHRELRLVLG